MYSRDPFNLRKAPPSALAYLHTAASHAQKATEKAAEAVSETVQAATEKVKDADMSFKLPQAIPDFDSAQRKFEDHVWNKFGGNESGLPMYKDKPTGYGVKRSGGRWGRKRVAAIALVVLGALYWFGWSSGGGSGEGVDGGKKSSWMPGAQTGKKGVDWNTRRESVKDAFLLSWRGYEEHGWGTFSWLYGRKGSSADKDRIRRVPPHCEERTFYGTAERHGLDHCGCLGHAHGHEPYN